MPTPQHGSELPQQGSSLPQHGSELPQQGSSLRLFDLQHSGDGRRQGVYRWAGRRIERRERRVVRERIDWEPRLVGHRIELEPAPERIVHVRTQRAQHRYLILDALAFDPELLAQLRECGCIAGDVGARVRPQLVTPAARVRDRLQHSARNFGVRAVRGVEVGFEPSERP
jgi:hypothetical protein